MTEPGNRWADELLDVILTRWRKSADTPSGLFNPWLDREWNHATDGPRTLVSQCRLIYNFARGYEIRGDDAYAELAHRGLTALHRDFASDTAGGWHWSVDSSGAVEDPNWNAYGHAFVILAHATAAQVFKNDAYRDRALATVAFMADRLTDRHGGLVWHVDTAGAPIPGDRSQNPMMHAFEGLLVLATVDDSGVAAAAAKATWQFLNDRLLGPGILPEWYDDDWHPVERGDHGLIDIGHAFEWAWLMSEAHALFGEESWLATGREFLAFGMAAGYDRAAGGIFSPIELISREPRRRKGWWEQCEAIRAMERHVVRHGAAEIREPLAQTIALAREHFIDDTYGGWYLAPPGLGDPVSLDKGNPFKLDYHPLNMCRELLGYW